MECMESILWILAIIIMLRKIFTDEIHSPFSLIVFDHHTDMQQPLMEGMISCGDWAGMVLDQNPALQQFILIGPAEDNIRQIRTEYPDKLITFSARRSVRRCGTVKTDSRRCTVVHFNRQGCAF